VEHNTEDEQTAPQESGRDPLTLSINTVRGTALHAVVRYALWVRRSFEEENSADKLAAGFAALPEVERILNEHLDIEKDPALAIRSVYGQWFPWLLLLDDTWARTAVDRIFPSGDANRAYRDAAWETYVRFCHPYDNVFAVLRSQYETAVRELTAGLKEPPRKMSDVDRQLAEHLMTFAWRGTIPVGPQGLLSEFWKNASAELRGHAIDFIGRSLYHTETAVPDAIQTRLKQLWKERLVEVRDRIAKGELTEELSGFGWWFASGKLDEDWMADQLLEVLRLGSKIEADHFVAERLVQLVPGMPKKVLDVLSALANADKEQWGIYSWRDEAKAILSETLRNPDPEIRSTAEAVVHQLGARGHFEFGELLPETSAR
jgi:hypothetical protein